MTIARPTSEVLADLMKCAGSWEPDARLLGDITAYELALASADCLHRLAGESAGLSPNESALVEFLRRDSIRNLDGSAADDCVAGLIAIIDRFTRKDPASA